MSLSSPTLHMMCGKMAAGKSTLAATLSDAPRTVLITEDDWLSVLYGDQMSTAADFVRYSNKLRAVIGPHVVALLNAGLTVVLDFAANTLAQRDWLRELLDDSGAAHQMHVLATPDEVCLARLRARNASGAHPFAPTEAMFHRFSKHFVAPTPEEGFNLMVHGARE